MPRPLLATISISALRHNLGVVRQHMAKFVQGADARVPSIWAVIKANAYGHGIENAVSAFSQAQGLAMLDLAEAVRCREAGWGGPILLLEGLFHASDIDLADRYHLSVVVHSREQMNMLQYARPTRPIDALIKLNSGMNRVGFMPNAYREAWSRAQQLRAQGVLGHLGKMTHFACADEPHGIADQLACFELATAGLLGSATVCNSAALLRYPQAAIRPNSEGAWIRPGICLYGSSPFSDASASSFGLLPAMTLSSELIATQHLKVGDGVGYGSLFRADAPMRVGVVACGYADGYPRHAPTGTPVYVSGVRTRLVGRVSMDMLTVDLSPVPDAHTGSSVVLWGNGGPSVDEVARAAGTIGYEPLCGLAQRVPVRVID